MDECFNTALDVTVEALEQEPCEDCVSRKAVLEYIEGSDAELGHSSENEIVCQDIKELPSVTPARKKGKWIDIMVGDMPAQACDQCNTFYPLAYTGGGHKYCPNCGSFMMERKEKSGIMKECCGNCKYNKRDFSKPQGEGYIEFYCCNEDSDEYGVPTFFDDTCDDFEENVEFEREEEEEEE